MPDKKIILLLLILLIPTVFSADIVIGDSSQPRATPNTEQQRLNELTGIYSSIGQVNAKIEASQTANLAAIKQLADWNEAKLNEFYSNITITVIVCLLAMLGLNWAIKLTLKGKGLI
jgi:hypothetical protein